MVKNFPAVQETLIWSLDQEDSLGKETATTPVFLPGEFHGQRSLSGSPWGCKELDTTEWITFTFPVIVIAISTCHYYLNFADENSGKVCKARK